MGINISSGIGSIANLIDDGINKIWPNKTQEQQDKFALLAANLKASMSIQLAQIAANTEAEKTQGFTFRDGAGWTCVVAFALAALRTPIEWAAALAGHPITLPAVDTSTTSSMLMALLGLGTMHLYQHTRSK